MFRRAQTWLKPHLTLTALAGNLTLTGLVMEDLKSGLLPMPRRPSRLSPKAQRVPSWEMKLMCFSEAEMSMRSWERGRRWGRWKVLEGLGESRLCWLFP